MIHATVTVHDRMQPNYRYLLSEPEGEHFDERFSPELTPKEMLALGVFGGKYMTDCRSEFPADWFREARLCPVLTSLIATVGLCSSPI